MNPRAQRYERAFELPMLVAALLVVPIIWIEQTRDHGGWHTLAVVGNWVVWSAFAVELLAMLCIVDRRRTWLHKHPLEIAVVLVTAPFVPASMQALRAFRLLRLLRLLLIPGLARHLFSLDGIRWAGLLAALTALSGGAGYAYVEKGRTTWDGVWWAVTTMTTVGYGDQYPVTVLGRLIGMALMLVGIGFLAVITGAVADRFLGQRIEQAQETVTTEVETAEADVLAELRGIMQRLQALEKRLQAEPR